MEKEIGYIGLGKMGAAMVENLIEHDWRVVVYDVNQETINDVVCKGAVGATSYGDLVARLKGSPKLIWIMVPWKFVDDVVDELISFVDKGDVIIDGGNSPFADSVGRHASLFDKGIGYLDVGVSGGPAGARNGACMMVGGDRALYDEYEELFREMCVEEGYGYMGKGGAGHFVKMVHNGIEYGMMQSIAEGFDIMRASDFDLKLKDVAHVYNHGSVITSSLIGWMENGFAKFGDDLEEVSATAHGLGEGEWTSRAAHELGVEDKVIHEAVNARVASESNPNYQAQIIMTLRNQFGGHDVTGGDKPK